MHDRIVRVLKTIKENFLHFSWLIFFLIPLFILLNLAFILIVKSQTEAIEIDLQTTAEREIKNIDLYINTQINAIHNDLYVINDANETDAFIADQTPENFANFESMIYRMSNNKPNFIQASIIDPNGDILFHVYRSNGHLITADDDLGSISDSAYYPILSELGDHQIYISDLHMLDDIPVITLAIPIFDDQENIVNYVQIDYNAESFLIVLDLYADDGLDYFSLGLMCNDKIWLANGTALDINLVTDETLQAEVFAKINNGTEIVQRTFDIRTNLEDFYVEQSMVVRIFMLYTLDAVIENSGYYAINNVWIIVVANIVLLAIASYFDYILRSKNEAQLRINANMYLSAQNENAVIISDRAFRVTYVNHAFEKTFGYSLNELLMKNAQEILRIEALYPVLEVGKDDDFAAHKWDMTKHGIYLLKYLRIKKQVFFGNRERHYIGIFSEPKIQFDDYIKYLANKEKETQDLKKLLDAFDYKIGESMLIMIRLSHIDTAKFAIYLRKNLDNHYYVAIPKFKHIMIYVNDKEHQLVIDKLDTLIDAYRFYPKVSKDYKHYFAIAISSAVLPHVEALIDAMVTTLSYRDNTHVKYHIYDPSMKMKVERDHLIYEALEDAFDHQEFYLQYQIQKNLETNTYDGAEALLRWQSPTLGPVYPNQFIPVIENSYFINQLSMMVVTLLIKDVTPYLDQIPKDFRFAINLSHFDFGNEYMIHQLIHAIEQSDLPTHLFTFEITESVYLDNIEKTNNQLAMLQEKDIQVAIDDFGKGYSSMNSLKTLNVDYVKTDRAFMMGYPAKDDGSMLKNMISVIHNLKKPVIVEGTETEEQIAFCRANNVWMIQGFGISKAIHFEDMLKQFVIKQKN